MPTSMWKVRKWKYGKELLLPDPASINSDPDLREKSLFPALLNPIADVIDPAHTLSPIPASHSQSAPKSWTIMLLSPLKK